MNAQTIKSFYVIGISVRTTNENGQAGKDIPALWDKFMKEGILTQIPSKTDDTVYCIYTDYEKDHTKPYTTILGCRVDNLNAVPAGMTGIKINEATYTKHTAQGNLSQGVVFNAWTIIWNSDLQRTYTADYEVYGAKALDFENAEVDIFIAVK